MTLRVLHQFSRDSVDEADLVRCTRSVRGVPGCLEAECYRSVVDPENLALTELWEDQHAFGDYWAHALAKPEDNPLVRAVGDGEREPVSEFYRHQYFSARGAWVAQVHKDRVQKVFWPAAGRVRVFIQSSSAHFDAVLPALLDNVRETRREPGCLQFAWVRGVEFPNHTALIELWESQAHYDAHWSLRTATGPSGPPPEPPPRQQGTNGAEFYRYERFRHLYDRWLPADVSRWSATVTWAG